MISLRGTRTGITSKPFAAAATLLTPLSIALANGRRALLHTTPIPSLAARLPPRPVLKEDDLHEAFVHGSGPGGQKINKTACAVQLKHLPTGLTITSQATRSRTQNRKIARRLLAEKVEVLERGAESRVAVKAAVKGKKKASKTKKARRKYRALSAGQSEDWVEDEDGDQDDEGEGKGKGEEGGDRDGEERAEGGDEGGGVQGVKEVVGRKEKDGRRNVDKVTGGVNQVTRGERIS